MRTSNYKKDIALSPALRFPKFIDVWNKNKLGEISQYSKDRVSTSKLNEHNFVGVDNMLPNLGGKVDSKYLPSNGNVSKYITGDILHSNIRPYLKKTWLADGEGGSSADVLIIRPNSDMDRQFLFYQITSDAYFKYVMSGSKGIKMPRGDKRHIMKYEVAYPSLEEQKKIASFLESTDKFIENLRTQKTVLEQYRKGIAQRIFAQEIRFKDTDGKSFPDWEEKRLNDVLKERKEFSTKSKGYPHISLTTQGVVPKSDRYDRDFLVGDDEIKGYKITRLNDLCYNPANLKFGVISLNKLGDGIFSPIYVTFEIVDQNVDFIGYYLTRTAFINKARRYEQGTVYERMAVSPEDFLKVKVKMPSLPEQEQIANYLKSLDLLIDTKDRQISYGEKWKKGLMQKLFI